MSLRPNPNLPALSRNAKQRHERISQQISKKGSTEKDISLEAIRARRARLEDLTRAMRNPRTSSRKDPFSKSPRRTRSDVKLKPIKSNNPNELDRRLLEDALIKRPKSSHNSADSIQRRTHLSSDEEVRVEEEEEEEEEEDNDDDDDGDNDEEDEEKEEHSEHHEHESNELKSTKEDEITRNIRKLRGIKEEERLEGAHRTRKALSVSELPPIDEYIKAGALPALISCMEESNPTLQFEAAWAITNISSGSSNHAHAVYEAGAVPHLIALLKSPFHRVADQSVWAIGNLVGDSKILWQSVIDEGAIAPLHALLAKNPTLSGLRNLSWTFSNILRQKPLTLSPLDTNYCVKAIRLFLHHPDKEVHLNACWSLVYFTDSDIDKISLVVEAGLLPRLVELLDSEDTNTLIPTTRALGNIMTGTDKHTDTVISADVIPMFVMRLNHSSVKIRKDSAWALSNVTAGSQEQIQKVIDGGALPPMAQALSMDSSTVRKEAAWCISNLTEGGTTDQVDKVTKYKMVTALSRMVDSEDQQLVQVSLEGLKNILEKCSNPIEVKEIITTELSDEDLMDLSENYDHEVRLAAVKLHEKIASLKTENNNDSVESVE